jgi:hypothetical protein
MVVLNLKLILIFNIKENLFNVIIMIRVELVIIVIILIKMEKIIQIRPIFQEIKYIQEIGE